MREKQLDFEVGELAPLRWGTGLVGLVQAAARVIGEDADELVAISSAAFCSYVYDPRYNQHEDTLRAYSPYALLFSNYGPWASIGNYTGRDIREVSALSAVETLKVVMFEIEHGRPLVTLTSDLEPAVVTGYRIGVEERTLITSHGAVELRDDHRLQGASEVFVNWLMLLRPGEARDWATPKVRQRVNVLRWAVEHGHNPKEFFQETRENYAPGLVGLQRLRASLEQINDPADAAFAERNVRMLAEQRGCAAVATRRWADDIATYLEVAEVAPQLHDAARAYEEASHALRDAETLSAALDAAIDAETRALRALAAAAEVFPSAFE